jgi:N-acetyl-gamma-glutamyl-phosphate reductase
VLTAAAKTLNIADTMIAGIIGATGYAGAELVRLLAGHPEITKIVPASVSFQGERIEAVYPNFQGVVSAELLKPEEAVSQADVVFAALPTGVGEAYAKTCMEQGKNFIDLSADFRFDDDEATFTAWYGKPYLYPELRLRSVYGLPELKRAQIRELANNGTLIIGNPGCYPTGASLGIYPAISLGIAARGAPIIVDAASGVTGGGREPSRAFHYPECADSFAPYKVGVHRHTPEICRNLAFMTRLASGVSASSVIFTPHLAPMNRGILSTIYIPLAEACRLEQSAPPRPPARAVTERAEEIREHYAAFYEREPFVRVLPQGDIASTSRVRQSNFCDISVHLDQAGTTLIIATAIDNMVKGAAGQAIQNMNIVYGFDERAGLTAIPASF